MPPVDCRPRNRRHVLAVADTSELNFATHTARKGGSGTVGNGREIGVPVNPIMAVDADQGGILGLVGAEVINRSKGRVERHKRRPTNEKESRCLLAGTETAGDVLSEAVMITVVEDRKGDIYDQFARCPDNAHLLVCAGENCTVIGDAWLFEKCSAWSEMPGDTITLLAKGGKAARAERTAVVAVRFGEVTVKQLSRRRQEPAGVTDIARGGCPRDQRTGTCTGSPTLVPADDACGADRSGGDTDCEVVPDALDHQASVPDHED